MQFKEAGCRDLLLANSGWRAVAWRSSRSRWEALRMPVRKIIRESLSSANDYRMLRIEELRLSAVAAAEKVKHTGAPFFFNPMNSRERRVIHMALRGETELRSESAGVGGHRLVVVYPAGMASVTPPPPPPPSPPPRDRDRDRGGRDRDRGSRPPRPFGRGARR